MEKVSFDSMTLNERYLAQETIALMDKFYDEKASLILGGDKKHDVRSSAYYAAGLLMRNQAGDLERACEIIRQIINTQYDKPGEIYHGTYRVHPEDPHPPIGNLPWKTLSHGWMHYTEDIYDKVLTELKKEIPSENAENFEKSFQTAVINTIPTVWLSYDPNWREFIGCTFAMIIAEFEDMLPKDIVKLIDDSMAKTVLGSVERRVYDVIAMNSNVEMMHIFMTYYFGERFNNEEWMMHAEREAKKCYDEFMEFKSLAEFNSPTYYGIDLFAFGFWRKYLKSETLKQIGKEMEYYLWEDIALFYNADMKNMCGPFARAYGMDMQKYVTTTGMFILLAIGKEYAPLPPISVKSEGFPEYCYGPIIAAIGTSMPEELKAYFETHQKDRQIERKFRETVERAKPGQRRNLCTVTAYIEKDLMIGAITGSGNTSGQLHPATVYWKDENGDVFNFRLIRREPNKHWSEHYWGIKYDGKAEKNLLKMDVDFDSEKEFELVFQVSGKNIDTSSISENSWQFPGLKAEVDAKAPVPYISQSKGRLEIVYHYNPEDQLSRHMSFNIMMNN